jgi:putative transposase
VVFLTTYQHTVFTDTHPTRLEEITRAICADFETELLEFNGHTNHVHLLRNFPPKVVLSPLANSPTDVYSRGMRERFPALTPHYWRAQRLWLGFYFTGSVVGAPTSVLRQYIPQQNQPT